MREEKKIVDTTLRDGEQQARIALSPEDKLEIALMLDELKVYEIEAGTPSMGMGEKEYIEALMKRKKYAKVSVWSRAHEKDVVYAAKCHPDLIHIGTPISYVQIYTKLRKNKGWIQKNLMACIEAAQNQGVEVIVGFEDASRADVGYMIHTAKLVKSLGVNQIRIADTVGILTPSRTRAMIREILAQVEIDIEIHVHNDLGMAIANSIDAIKAGAKYVDCTLLGLGERCGNCNLYHFIHAAERFYDFGVDKRQVRSVEKQLGALLETKEVKEGIKNEQSNCSIIG